MKVDEANAIPMTKIIDILGYDVLIKDDTKYFYLSPLHCTKSPCFCVFPRMNTWFDQGLEKGGNVVDFVCAYLTMQEEDHTVFDALRWLENMMTFDHESHDEPVFFMPKLKLQSLTSLKSEILLSHLKDRGIPLHLAKKYFREACVHNVKNGKTICALAMENENGGYALRNETFSGHTPPDGVSFIRGFIPLPDKVNVFKSSFDFLSALIYQRDEQFLGDSIILHRYSNLSGALPYIKNYSYKTIRAWMDNADEGHKADQLLATFAHRHKLSFETMHHEYSGYRDFNAWHLHKL